MKRIIISMVFVLFVYRIHFDIFPVDIFSYFYALTSLTYIMINYKISKCLVDNINRKTKNIMVLSMYILLIAITIAMLSIVKNNGEYSYLVYLLNAFGMISIHTALVILVYKNYRHDSNTFIVFCNYYISAAIIYIISTVIMLAVPEIKENWIPFLINAEESMEQAEELFPTRIGLRGFSSVQIAFINNIAVMLCLCCLRITNKIKYLLYVFILVLGDVFYARWGIVATIVLISMHFVFMSKKTQMIKQILFTFIYLLIVCVSLLYMSEENEMFALAVRWLSQPIDAFVSSLQYGEISFGSSADHLYNNMYFMPDEKTLIWGDGRFKNTDGSYYCHVDPGIMRNVLFFGVIGELVSYLSFTLFISSILFVNKCRKYYNNVIFLQLIFLFYFAEIKFNVFYDLFGIGTAMVLLFGLIEKHDMRDCDDKRIDERI